MLTDDNQQVVWEAEYTPFGEANITVEQVVNNLRFPGQYYDQETGLHQNWFRDYDPSTGRYIESDPIGLGGGINTYGYAGQNSVINSDPLGLFRVKGYTDTPEGRNQIKKLESLGELLKQKLEKCECGLAYINEFENWEIEIRDKVFGDYAITQNSPYYYSSNTYVYNGFWKAKPDMQAVIFYHEFRHVLDSIYGRSSSSHENESTRDAADIWAMAAIANQADKICPKGKGVKLPKLIKPPQPRRNFFEALRDSWGQLWE